MGERDDWNETIDRWVATVEKLRQQLDTKIVECDILWDKYRKVVRELWKYEAVERGEAEWT